MPSLSGLLRRSHLINGIGHLLQSVASNNLFTHVQFVLFTFAVDHDPYLVFHVSYSFWLCPDKGVVITSSDMSPESFKPVHGLDRRHPPFDG